MRLATSKQKKYVVFTLKLLVGIAITVILLLLVLVIAAIFLTSRGNEKTKSSENTFAEALQIKYADYEAKCGAKPVAVVESVDWYNNTSFTIYAPSYEFYEHEKLSANLGPGGSNKVVDYFCNITEAESAYPGVYVLQ